MRQRQDEGRGRVSSGESDDRPRGWIDRREGGLASSQQADGSRDREN
jgi:hypothetical protein